MLNKYFHNFFIFSYSKDDGDILYVEPFRAKAFPLVRDLKVGRSSFDAIIRSGGYISASTGQAPEANSIPISHQDAEDAFDAAACIGCGACVAACKNASASLFTSSKITQMVILPQGKLERKVRVMAMVCPVLNLLVVLSDTENSLQFWR